MRAVPFFSLFVNFPIFTSSGFLVLCNDAGVILCNAGRVFSWPNSTDLLP